MIYPWPPKELSPNARCHWAKKAKIAKKYKEDCYWITKSAGLMAPKPPVAVHIEFHPPDARRRDMDNMLASLKSGIDGIAQARGIDDSNFRYTLEIGGTQKGKGFIIVSMQSLA